jgi:hypothetical protein
MPDSPDYSKFLGSSIRFSLQDLGELAARLGSVMSYDRRGEILWFDNFAYGITGWTAVNSGTGSGVKLDAGNGLHSGYAAKLTAGSNGSRLAGIVKIFSIFETGRSAVEVCFEPTSGVEHIILRYTFTSGGLQYVAEIKIRYDNNTIEYQSSNGVYTTIVTDFDDEAVYTKLVFAKLVIDTNKKEYVRILVNHHQIDMTGIAIPDAGAFAFIYFQARVHVVGTAGSNDPILVKQVIFTSNEP